MQNLTRPDSQGPLRVMTEVSECLASLSYVLCIQVFGSLARDAWDQWSDVDLVVVTESRDQFQTAFEHLSQQKTVLYRGLFTPHVEPHGGRVLGIIFQDESVFHCLDLNFLTGWEDQMTGAWDRFGPTRLLYHTSSPFSIPTENHILSNETESPVENRITTAQHFTKKQAKKILRGQADTSELYRWSQELKEAMQSPDVNRLGPGILCLGRSYVQIADILLNGED